MSNVQDYLANSYKDSAKQAAKLDGYTRDDKLSGKRVQVYTNELGEARVTHRGSSSLADAITDLKIGLGGVHALKKTKRYHHAKKIQNQAEQLYDVKDTAGHSLGGLLAKTTAKQGKVTTYNTAAPIHKVKPSVKSRDIRSKGDAVSFFGRKGSDTHLNKRSIFNPLGNHSLANLSKKIRF
jgi:hypothetical protein